MDSLARVREFQEVVVSPDGSHVAWVESLPAKDGNPSGRSAIYVAGSKEAVSSPRRITAGKGDAAFSEHSVAWSPDGRVAFLSDREKPGQLQLYMTAASGGPVHKLTNLTGFLATPAWSPDGKQIALLFTENAPRAAGPLVAATADSGVVGEKIFEQRLAVVDPESGSTRIVSPADLYVYEYDWSPDSSKVIATAAHGSGDNNWYIAQLYAIAIASGETQSILKPSMQIAVPHWSPDGKTIAFIGGLMSDEGIPAGDIYTVSSAGGDLRNLTPRLKASAVWLTWVRSSNRILFAEHIDGNSGIAALDPATGDVTTLWTGPEVFLSFSYALNLSLARDGKTSAVIRSSFEHPPEVWGGEIGAWKQLTHANREARPDWGEARSLHWTSDGLSIQGWLVYPKSYDRNRRYPMIVMVHGGPSWMSRSQWPQIFFNLVPLAHEGYFVFLPNPRGSYGQGEEFTRANVRDFGYGDLRDILAGVDEVVRTVPVDDKRIGISGWSYGGFMTMWSVAQTRRFNAAVAGAGIANWQSYYGQNLIDQWMIPFFGASVYDDPAIYARSAPINFVKNVNTPTLILVGDRDAECPAPQSYEFWHALKTLGVKTEFVIYPNEGHHIGKPDHQRDIMKRTLAWFDRHLR